MQITIKKSIVAWGRARTVVTLGWLLGVTSLAWGGTVGDFNNDGFTDLAIGVPFEDVGIISNAGSVHILYGSATGLSATGNQLFSQDTPDIKEVAETGDLFGAVLAAGDFDNDGFTDLAIGVPEEDVGTIGNAGAVHILYGSATGLSATGNQLFSQDTPDIRGAAQARDRFGAALATGDFDNDGFTDLAIGVPIEDVGTISNAGAVHILYGSATGLSATGNQLFSQDTPDIKEVAESGDLFGAALATGDFDNDGFTDLAIGVTREDLRNGNNAGVVHILYGSATGLSATGNQLFSQDTPDIKEVAHFGDRFGTALATGDFDNDGFTDLAIGVPGEVVRRGSNAGAVHILYGSATGLSATGNQLFSQDTPDMNGAAHFGDRFGAALATGDFDNDGFTDLAIGVPGEAVRNGNTDEAGVVHILYGSATGLSATGNQLFFQDTPDIKEVAETGDRFGAALATGDFDGDDFTDLAIGVPFEDVGTISNAGAMHILYGSGTGLSATGNQLFSQDTPDIRGTAESDDAFGYIFEIFP